MTREALVEAHDVLVEALGRRARADPSVFVDLIFQYESADFQRRWHRAIAEHDRLVIWAPVEHGKTQQITTAWPLWMLGTNPKARGAIVGATFDAAVKPFGVVKALIQRPPPILRRVFPGLRRDRGPREDWTDSTLRVEGASTTEKDPSLMAVGVGSQALMGTRLDFAVIDDVLNFSNTYTSDQRGKVTSWLLSTLLGRMVEGSKVVIVGNSWFPDDAMHVMVKDHGFFGIRDEAYRENDRGEMIASSVLWPKQWTLPRLSDRRRELGTVEALRQLRCQPYAQGQGRFRLEWFDWAFEAGEGMTFVPETERYTGGWPTFIGVDLGVQQKEKHDKTAFFCIAVSPDGRRHVLNAFEDRLTGPDIVAKLKRWYQAYGAVVMVENNSAQDFIRQFARDAGIPTRPFTTGKQKADPAFGIPSLGVELEQRMWILPHEPAMHVWRSQCLNYSPGQHTGDLLMASWFAREAVRTGTHAAAASAGAPTTGHVDYSRLRARYGGRYGVG